MRVTGTPSFDVFSHMSVFFALILDNFHDFHNTDEDGEPRLRPPGPARLSCSPHPPPEARVRPPTQDTWGHPCVDNPFHTRPQHRHHRVTAVPVPPCGVHIARPPCSCLNSLSQQDACEGCMGDSPACRGHHGRAAVQLLRDSFRCTHDEPGRCSSKPCTLEDRGSQVEGRLGSHGRVSPRWPPDVRRSANDKASTLLHQGGPVTQRVAVDL